MKFRGIRVAAIEKVKVQAINTNFNHGHSIKIRLPKPLLLSDYIQNLDQQMISFATRKGSLLRVYPADISELYVSYIVRFEYYNDRKRRWEPSTAKQPLRRRRIFGIERAKVGLKAIIEDIMKELNFDI